MRLAVFFNHYQLTELISLNPNLKIDWQDEDGNTFLIIAAKSGSLEAVKLLLLLNAEVNI